MAWTNKIPTTPGWKFWRRNKTQAWGCLFVIDFQGLFIANDEFCSSVEEVGGEWWDTPVPAPGTSWSVGEINLYLEQYLRQTLPTISTEARDNLNNPQDGIAATTERNKKEAE